MTARSDLRFTFTAGPDAFEVVELHLSESLSETQQLIAQARTGAIELHSHFTTCSDAFWKCIVADLPRARDYA